MKFAQVSPEEGVLRESYFEELSAEKEEPPKILWTS